MKCNLDSPKNLNLMMSHHNALELLPFLQAATCPLHHRSGQGLPSLRGGGTLSVSSLFQLFWY